jgi:Ca2+-binding EF-hand superfamily protein
MGGISAPSLDFESGVDEIVKLIRQFVELRSGFGEDYVKSRTLQNIFKQFDIDHTNTLTAEELSAALRYMNIECTSDERKAVFERFDMRRSGCVTFKDFSDAMFGIVAVPLGNPEARAVLKKVRAALIKKAGEDALHRLTRAFAAHDKDKDGALTKEELFNCLQQCGVPIAIAETEVIVKNFDPEGKGRVPLSELLRGLRGFLSDRRRKLIDMAYGCVDQHNAGVVTLDDIVKRYDASGHPDVISAKSTAEEVTRRFLSNWKVSNPSSVTRNEFADYYRNVSAMIDSDSFFESMMRGVWHLAGGDGPENTASRRVLVTFKDSHQEILEISNDLGARMGNQDAMREALQQQGILDVLKVESYS